MPTKRETLKVAGGASLRLDRFLADRYPEISRAYLQEIIAGGFVSVNGMRARKARTLNPGDEVTVESFVRPEERTIAPNPEIPLSVVWKSDALLVVDKQPGLPTHPNDFSDTHTLAGAVLARFPEIAGVGEDPLRPGIVHRLDTDTSGLLMVARTQDAYRAVRELFDQRKVKKTYWALVLGDLSAEGEISTPLAHHPSNPRKMVAVTGEKLKEGTFRSKLREAQTLYKPLERFGGYTLLEVKTLTGRMHQVRVHLSSIGHPLAGDRLYQTTGEKQKDRCGLKRHFLHAVHLSLPIPPDNQLKSFESPLEKSLEELLGVLRKADR